MDSLVEIPLDEQYSLSLELVQRVFPNSLHLKYRHPESDVWRV